jgi:hypothetical protein
MTTYLLCCEHYIAVLQTVAFDAVFENLCCLCLSQQIYPPTNSGKAVLTADQWLAGETRNPELVSLKPPSILVCSFFLISFFLRTSRTSGRSTAADECARFNMCSL